MAHAQSGKDEQKYICSEGGKLSGVTRLLVFHRGRAPLGASKEPDLHATACDRIVTGRSPASQILALWLRLVLRLSCVCVGTSGNTLEATLLLTTLLQDNQPGAFLGASTVSTDTPRIQGTATKAVPWLLHIASVTYPGQVARVLRHLRYTPLLCSRDLASPTDQPL